MKVYWGLPSLTQALEELSIARPLLISTSRWRTTELPVERRFYGALPHAERSGVAAALKAAEGADGLAALGGGSAIDTAKAVSSETGLPIVSIPTTYSGAEWTPFFGSRDSAQGTKASGDGARTTGIVYEPALTLDLPPGESCGTALNALAHCAEALTAPNRTEETDRDALAGAALIARWLPAVMTNGQDAEARLHLLEGAMHAGAALRAGMGVGHAMAQAIGGRYGLPHGAMNAVCLPHALAFNAPVAGEAIGRFGAAMGTDDPVATCHRLGELGCAMRLRDYGVAEADLPELAEKAAERPAAKSNPRPAPVEAVLELLRAAW
jgi:maleylacetate reductase